MVVPLDTIRAIHNALRQDIATMDDVANTAAHGNGSLDLLLERYVFFNEVLVWHAVGDEEFVFPKVEQVAPLVSIPYETDHRGLDSLSDRLSAAVRSPDRIEILRITSALSFHLGIHLDKEEAHLYRVYDERVSLQEQGVINGKMAGAVPRDRYPEFVMWLMSLTGPEDRENMTRIWQQNMQGPVFTSTTDLIRKAIGDDWSELVRRVPELEVAGRS